MKTTFVLLAGLVLAAANGFSATSNELTAALQRGLFEEEANQDFNAAIEAYKSVVDRFDKDRKLAATAVFRLGECYRKQGQTNEAALFYKRVAAEFADHTTLAELSRKYLGRSETTTTAPRGVPLATSMEDMEINRIKKLLAESPDLINAKGGSPERSTLLHNAVRQQQLRVAEFLLANGAEVDAADGVAQTPLLIAVQQGNRALVEMLISRGASVNARLPLHTAAEKGFRNIAELLLAKGAQVNAANSTGTTALHQAAANGFKSMVELLLEKGADPNTVSRGSGTPLHSAVNAGHDGTVELLLKAKAKTDIADSNGNTPLHIAAEKGQGRIAELLIGAGAKVNIGNTVEDKLGWTPLHSAADAGHSAMCELLLQKGAEPNAKANGGQNYSGTWPVTPLLLAASRGHQECVQVLLAAKADPNAATGRPIIACAIGMPNIIKLLLQNGANPDTVVDSSGVTILAYAAQGRIPGSVEALLEYKANPNSKDKEGYTALHRVLFNRSPGKPDETTQIVKALVAGGADVNALSNDGTTPLRFASDYYPDAAQVLRSKGAQLSAPNPAALSITRPGWDQCNVVFRKDSLGWNRYTAMEVIAEAYRGPSSGPGIPLGYNIPQPMPILPGSVRIGQIGSSSRNNSLSFPDLEGLKIRRPRSTKPGDDTLIDLNITTNILCERDVVLEFGDIIEIPEREHTLAEQAVGLDRVQLAAFDKCLARKVRIVSKGKELEVDVAPESAYLSSVLRYSKVLPFLSSNSDFSRVKVKSTHPTTKEARETVLDVQVFQSGRQPLYEDIRLRDGDVIEVPEKP